MTRFIDRLQSISHGPAPQILSVDGLEGAAAAAISFVKQWRTENGERLSFCVVGHSERVRDGLAQQLQAAGLACATITAQSNHAGVQDVVHLATMHRAKGLEFDCVVVVTPISYLGAPEDTEGLRKLLYVALTRAKRGALMVQMP